MTRNMKVVDDAGLNTIAQQINKKLTQVSSMPQSPVLNTIVLYVGTTTSSYTQGSIYQYDGTQWNQIGNGGGGSSSASAISYDNTTSGLNATNVQNAIDEVTSKKADKVASVTNGNLAGLDSNGNLTDSGKAASKVYTTDDAVINILASGDYFPFYDASNTGPRKASPATMRDYLVSLATEFTALDDADYIPVYDSSAMRTKKSLWSNIKSTLKTYFDTLYAKITGLAPAFSTSTNYAVGDYVTYEGDLYKCTTAHTAGDWDSTHFTAATVTDDIKNKVGAPEAGWYVDADSVNGSTGGGLIKKSNGKLTSYIYNVKDGIISNPSSSPSATSAPYRTVRKYYNTSNGTSSADVRVSKYQMKGTFLPSTSSSTTITFTNSNIKHTCIYSVYTEIFGLNPTNIAVNETNHTCTITFPPVATSYYMDVILEFDDIIS